MTEYSLKAILGPTNTGKTHRAVERMLAHESGTASVRRTPVRREAVNQPHMAGPDGIGMGLQDSIFNRLLRERIIWLGSEVRDDNANAICAQMMLLAAEDPEKDIYLYVNSPGGSITAGMAIYDTMQFIKPDVSTLCIGMAASMGAFLLAAGAKGKRFVLPNSTVMIHQPLGGFQGQASDIEIHAKYILSLRERLNRLLALHTGKSIEQVGLDTERDNFLTAESAQEYGIVDKVLHKRVQGA